jgi:hypothetical protein
MEKAGDIVKASETLKKLVGQGTDLVVSKRKLGRIEAIEMARAADTPRQQQLVYSTRPFVLCGLPVKRPAKGILLHERRNGKFNLEITGHPKYGLPFGQDRLIPIWVATLALRQKNRFIYFKSAAEILDTFGLHKDGKTYRRLVDGFQRIFSATIFFGTNYERGPVAMYEGARFHFFDQMKVWYTKQLDQQQLPSEDFQNQILLSENFWNELKRHPIPINLEAVKILANAPAELDFYTWLVWRSWTAKKETRIPLLGESGLIRQLGISDKTAAREFRRQIKRWLTHIKAVDIWPDCPAVLDGDSLILQHSKAIAARISS